MVDSKALQSFSVFRGLDEDELRAIASLLREQEYRAGSDIYSPGEPSENLYLLERGEALITHQLDGDIVTLARLKPGYFFGEAGILSTNQKHQTRAQAASDSALLALSARQFAELTESNPRVAAIVLANIASVLSSRLNEDAMRIGILSAVSYLTGDPAYLNNIEKLASEILRITLKAIPAHHAFLGVFQKHDIRRLHVLAASGISAKALPRDLPVNSDPYLSHLAAEDGEVLLTSSRYKDEEKVFYAKRNLLGRTIRIEENNVGVILLADKRSGEFSMGNSLILQIIAAHIAFALEEAWAREERKAREELGREYIGI